MGLIVGLRCLVQLVFEASGMDETADGVVGEAAKSQAMPRRFR